MLKIYCDANIFMDYYLSREDPLRPLGLFAFNFFSKGWNCAFHLVISDWLLFELRKHLEESKIQEILQMFEAKNKLHVVNMTKEDRESAKNMSNHWHDALHVILANKSQAYCLVTRNLKDFENFENIIAIRLPEFI